MGGNITFFKGGFPFYQMRGTPPGTGNPKGGGLGGKLEKNKRYPGNFTGVLGARGKLIIFGLPSRYES